MSDKTILQRLDGLVGWTGVPALASGHPRRRPLRGPATVALGAAVVGYAITMLGGTTGVAYWVGYILLIVGFAGGGLLSAFGPLKPFGSIERVDEWDRALRTSAYLVTFTVFVFATAVAWFALIAALALDWPRTRIVQGAVTTFFLLQTIVTVLPTAYASWTVRWQADDDQAG